MESSILALAAAGLLALGLGGCKGPDSGAEQPSEAQPCTEHPDHPAGTEHPDHPKGEHPDHPKADHPDHPESGDHPDHPDHPKG